MAMLIAFLVMPFPKQPAVVYLDAPYCQALIDAGFKPILLEEGCWLEGKTRIKKEWINLTVKNKTITVPYQAVTTIVWLKDVPRL
ncbi:hypothetical protein [Methylohalobius crimeensis]|uniref:hypothetical protein n=1 Tax=Methylohalobius crimeensis TaxID=244365 RepID=UPI001269165F|nr:hypothetical protein [Methylohalobius crimeensis]